MGKVSLPALYIRDHAGLLTSLPSVGRSATHALVQAQLICSGAQQGMHAFIVPIRSLEDHSPLPGKLMLLSPGPLPGDRTRPPCPGAPEVHGRNWGMSPLGREGSSCTDLALTGWMTMSKIQHLTSAWSPANRYNNPDVTGCWQAQMSWSVGVGT